MEQIIKREKKSFFRIVLVLLALVLLVNTVIMFLDKITKKMPYLTTLISIGLVTLACGFIIIRYMSSISYLILGDYLIFNRIIGKREFEILRIELRELFFVGKESEDKEYKKPLFNFSLDREDKYIGKYRRDGKVYSFLFSPNEEFLKELKKSL